MLRHVTLFDTNFNGNISNQLLVKVSSHTLSIAEIIKARISQELDNYNKDITEKFYGLVKPKNSEAVLNGYKLKKNRTIDAEKQLYVALDAFQKKSVFYFSRWKVS